MFGREFKAAEHRRHIPPVQRVGYGIEPVGRTAASLDAFEQEGYDAWHRDDPAAPAANKMVMDALEGVPVGDSSTIEIMKAFSRGFERGRQEMMDREFPEMKGASRKTALKWKDTDFNSWVKMDGGAWSIEVEEVGGTYWLYLNGGPNDAHMEALDASSMSEAKSEAERVIQGLGITASRTADRWLLDDLAEAAGLSQSLGNGWSVLQTNGGGPVLFREFNDYDSGKVSPPDSPGGPWNWSVHARLYQVNVGSGAANTADEAMSMVEQTYAEYKRTASRTAAGKCPKCDGMGRETYETDTGSLSTQTCTACGGTGQAKEAARRTAFLDTMELPKPRHRVAGWDWDDHLNGFIAAEAAREFTCACGDNVPAPGYTDCRCGKRWNTYTISANGSKKMIAREVPVRENVVMARRTASRKQAATYHITQVQQDPSIVKPGDLIATDNSRGRVHKILPPDGMGIMVIMMEDGGRFTLRTSARKQAAPSSGADAIAQHFPGWRVDDENGNFWEIHSPGGEHAFIHEEDGTYTVLTNDNTPDEFWETGLSFEDALAEVRAEGII